MYLETQPPHPRHPHPWEANRVLHTISLTLVPLERFEMHNSGSTWLAGELCHIRVIEVLTCGMG